MHFCGFQASAARVVRTISPRPHWYRFPTVCRRSVHCSANARSIGLAPQRQCGCGEPLAPGFGEAAGVSTGRGCILDAATEGLQNPLPAIDAGYPLEMKLRIRNNTIRLRLSQSDVNALQEDCLLSSAISFPGGEQFSHSLECSPASVRPSASFSDGDLRVVLPESVVQAWAGSEQISIEAEQVLDSGDVLAILIEKDYQCLSPREGDDDADSFPHPEQGRQNC